MTDDIEIRFASDSEAPACLAILPVSPGEARPGGARDILIARRRGDFAGAAAIVWRNEHGPAGFPVEVVVLPDHRRKGVGRALVDAADVWCEGETEGLWSGRWHALDSEAAAFLYGCAFEPREVYIEFRVPLESALDRLAPLRRRLAAREGAARPGRARPRLARILDAHLEAATWLIAHEIGGHPATIFNRLRGAVATTDEAIGGLVLLDGDDVVGAIVWHVDGPLAYVETRVVAPAWRDGVTNLMLMNAAMDAAQRLGVEEITFKSHEGNTDTVNLARMLGAKEAGRLALFHRPREGGRPVS